MSSCWQKIKIYHEELGDKNRKHGFSLFYVLVLGRWWRDMSKHPQRWTKLSGIELHFALVHVENTRRETPQLSNFAASAVCCYSLLMQSQWMVFWSLMIANFPVGSKALIVCANTSIAMHQWLLNKLQYATHKQIDVERFWIISVNTILVLFVFLVTNLRMYNISVRLQQTRLRTLHILFFGV